MYENNIQVVSNENSNLKTYYLGIIINMINIILIIIIIVVVLVVIAI